MDDGARGKDAAVTRAELERALRHVNLMVASLRNDLLALGAQVSQLTEELDRREVVDEDDLMEALPAVVERVALVDEDADPRRVDLGPVHIDKYMLPELPIPCAELLPLCKARCCSLHFVLDIQDLNEGLVCWDYARPYWIRQREVDGYCVHCDSQSYDCGLYRQRPAPCREFDCRGDDRIWIDYDQRIPAPADANGSDEDDDPKRVRDELMASMRQRTTALFFEEAALDNMYGKRVEVDTVMGRGPRGKCGDD